MSLERLPAIAASLIDAVLRDVTAADPVIPERDFTGTAALEYASAVLLQEEVLEELERQAQDSSSLYAGLPADDRARVRDFALYRGEARLERALDRWARHVQGCERHPSAAVFESYEDALMGRDDLELALSLLSSPALDRVAERLRPIDRRFLAATCELSAPLTKRDPWAPSAWWWYRVPRDAGEYFIDYVRHLRPELLQEITDLQSRRRSDGDPLE
ncbi:MAG TPA: hypothetical protein VGW10_09635 [Solirubrobacteraceae bacterium]|nr:hypothetical protein [Solirubrobacteraceae bacterium]